MSSSSAAKALSIVVPVFNEERNLPVLYDAIVAACALMPSYAIEIVFVDDGSHDKTPAVLEDLARKDSRVAFVSLSRNFGKEIALTAGINAATGDAVITMDGDLQHPPAVIPALVTEWEHGAEVVVGMRMSTARESFIRWNGSRGFAFLMNRIADVPSVRGATDFRLIDRKVAEAFRAFGERRRFTRGLIDWLGFRRAYVPFTAPARRDGAARYGYRKLVGLAFSAIVAHSFFPLRLVGYLGLATTLLGGALGVFVIIEQPLLGDPLGLEVSGTAMIAIMILFLVGIILVSLGMMALYIESITTEVTNRPLYVVRDRVSHARRD